MADAVGSGAISIKKAIIAAGLCEFAGAFLVGSHVTDTVRKGIVDPQSLTASPETLALGMACALLAAALWLNAATLFGMPVSTTHSIVGAIAGFGVVAAGWAAVDWKVMGKIVASWFVSPLAGAFLGYWLFKLINRAMLGRERPAKAAITLTPFIVFLMTITVTLATIFKGLKHLVKEGYSVLMYDQRNHGNSGKGTNQWITGGVEESKDVIAAVKYISNHKDYKDAGIGLLSFCQGANATTYAFGAAHGLRDYPNIKAFISLQPMYTNATFLEAFGFSSKMVKKADKLNLDRGGMTFYKSCFPLVDQINVPTMVAQLATDKWTDLDKVKEYYNDLTVEKEMYWIEGPKNRIEAYDWFNHHPEKMIEFFGKYLGD